MLDVVHRRDSLRTVTYQERLQPTPQLAKLTARDFIMLAEAGAFEAYRRTELIEGEIWVLNSVWSWHAKTMSRMDRELGRVLDASGLPYELFVPVSVLMSDDSVPEPDLAIGEDNAEGPLPLANLKLIVEVSDTTAKMDLGRKARLYARHGVPEYWVVHRDGGCIVQHSGPGDTGYAMVKKHPFGSPITAASLPGFTVDTSRIVGG
jgi:Uma2 family endonuclease